MKFDSAPGLIVHIDVHGRSLAEYDDEDEDTNNEVNNVKFVEATSGVEFGIQIHFGRAFPYRRDDIGVRVYLDGELACGKVVKAGSPDAIHRTCHFEGIYSCENGQWTLENFTFANLQTTDGVVQACMKKAFNDLGTIKVEFHRVASGPYVNGEYKNPLTSIKEGVPEKALKGRAISSQTKLGAPERVAPGSVVQVEYPYGKDAIAVAIFKYRSRKDLQVDGIVPRSPSPVPLEERDPDDLSPDEARELVRRMRAQQTDAVRIKQEVKQEKRTHAAVVEDDTDDDADEVTVCGSGPSKRTRTSCDSGVDIVDLADD